MIPKYTGPPVPDEVFVDEALKIIGKAQERDLYLRVVGSLAIRIHSPEYADLQVNLGRLGENKQNFSDLDFIAYGKQREGVVKLFEKELRYKSNSQLNFIFGKHRRIYYQPDGKYHVDVFFDKLDFSHTVYFGDSPKDGRLSLDSPTITLTDLMLEKLQIHDINEKDIKDIIVLLRAHELGCVDQKEIINIEYICKLLADDWGFWYDAKINLGKVVKLAEIYLDENKLEIEDFDDVKVKVQSILKRLDAEPKTKSWDKRAKIGESKAWWRRIEEVAR